MSAPTSLTARGYWREGDDPGARRFLDIGALPLDSGAVLPDVRLAYETWGELAPDRSNVVLVEHALTGDSHVVGPAGPGHPTSGWWEGLIGPGRPVDTDRWFVLAANVVGGCQGSTGPSSPAPDGVAWGSRFPALTIRDQVRAEERLLDELGIEHVALVLGGSMGGMRVLEWAVAAADRVQRALVLACGATATADQIAWAWPQLLAIRQDPAFHGGDYYDRGEAPHTGLGIARRIAHTTYRSARELDERFGRDLQPGEGARADGARYAVESYLDHHADKLTARFDAGSYLVLTEAMSSHDVGRGRGGLAAALATVRARVIVTAVTSDRLYLPEECQRLADLIPGAAMRIIDSPHGHDGFLIESEAVAQIVREALALGV